MIIPKTMTHSGTITMGNNKFWTYNEQWTSSTKQIFKSSHLQFASFLDGAAIGACLAACRHFKSLMGGHGELDCCCSILSTKVTQSPGPRPSVGLEHWKCLLRLVTRPAFFCIFDNAGNNVATRKSQRLHSQPLSYNLGPCAKPAHMGEYWLHTRLQVHENSWSQMVMLRFKTLSAQNCH